MISPRHIDRIKNQGAALVQTLTAQERDIKWRIVFCQRILCDMVILGFELALEVYTRYSKPTPCFDEINALKVDLQEWRKNL